MSIPFSRVVLPKSVIRRFPTESSPEIGELQSRQASLVLPCASGVEFDNYCTAQEIDHYDFDINFPNLPAFTWGNEFTLRLLKPGQPQPPNIMSTIYLLIQVEWSAVEVRDHIIQAINNDWVPMASASWPNYQGMFARAAATGPEERPAVEWFMPFGPALVGVTQGTFSTMVMAQDHYGVDMPLLIGQWGPGNKVLSAVYWQPGVDPYVTTPGYRGPLPHEFRPG